MVRINFTFINSKSIKTCYEQKKSLKKLYWYIVFCIYLLKLLLKYVIEFYLFIDFTHNIMRYHKFQ